MADVKKFALKISQKLSLSDSCDTSILLREIAIFFETVDQFHWMSSAALYFIVSLKSLKLPSLLFRHGLYAIVYEMMLDQEFIAAHSKAAPRLIRYLCSLYSYEKLRRIDDQKDRTDFSQITSTEIFLLNLAQDLVQASIRPYPNFSEIMHEDGQMFQDLRVILNHHKKTKGDVGNCYLAAYGIGNVTYWKNASIYR